MSKTHHHHTTRRMFEKLRSGLAERWNFKRAFRKMWEYTEKSDEIKAKQRVIELDAEQQKKEIQ